MSVVLYSYCFYGNFTFFGIPFIPNFNSHYCHSEMFIVLKIYIEIHKKKSAYINISNVFTFYFYCFHGHFTYELFIIPFILNGDSHYCHSEL